MEKTQKLSRKYDSYNHLKHLFQSYSTANIPTLRFVACIYSDIYSVYSHQCCDSTQTQIQPLVCQISSIQQGIVKILMMVFCLPILLLLLLRSKYPLPDTSSRSLDRRWIMGLQVRVSHRIAKQSSKMVISTSIYPKSSIFPVSLSHSSLLNQVFTNYSVIWRVCLHRTSVARAHFVMHVCVCIVQCGMSLSQPVVNISSGQHNRSIGF